MIIWRSEDKDAKNLSTRFLWIILPTVGISTVILFLTFGLVHLRALEQDLSKQIEQTLDINGRLLSMPFWYLDSDNTANTLRRCGFSWIRTTHAQIKDIDAILRSMIQDTDIMAVVARDQNGTQFCHHGLAAERLTGFDRMNRRVYFTHNDTPYDVGELEVYFTDRRIQELVEQRTYFDLLLLVLLMAVISVSVWVANQRSIKVPLGRLLQSIRMNKYELRRKPVEWRSQDELGQLIREYNEMVELQARDQEETQTQKALLEATLQNVRQGVCMFNENLELVVWNAQYTELLGLSADHVQTGTPLTDVLRFNTEPGEYGDVKVDWISIARHHDLYATERTLADGRVILIEINPMPQGGCVVTYTDITERKQAEARMRHMALHDALTGLPNRTLFTDRLHHAVSFARRHDQGMAVMFIDLDRFKDVNDMFGHDVGDMLIKEMGERLAHVIRDSDTAARLGGDEFAVIQSDVEKAEDATILAERIITEIARPFSVRGHMLHTSASIGLTLFPEDSDSPEQLVKNADIAMYAAKAKGRNDYRFFTPEMHDNVHQRKTVEADLRKALEEDELILHYQPKISTTTGKVDSVEALVRWQHPEKGVIQPDDFIPVAEECGLVVELGKWVLKQACRQGRIWNARQGQGIRIAVNLSATHFNDHSLVRYINRMLEEYALDHSLLEVEITESTLMQDPDQAVETLKALDALGVVITIDDFGIGYSSLNYLKRFPVSNVKIDRSFVRDLMTDPDDKAIIDAVIGLGHSLKIDVVAEGVEESTQFDYLCSRKCNTLQGFYFSQALPPEDCLVWMTDYNKSDDEAKRLTPPYQGAFVHLPPP